MIATCSCLTDMNPSPHTHNFHLVDTFCTALFSPETALHYVKHTKHYFSMSIHTAQIKPDLSKQLKFDKVLYYY